MTQGECLRMKEGARLLYSWDVTIDGIVESLVSRKIIAGWVSMEPTYPK